MENIRRDWSLSISQDPLSFSNYINPLKGTISTNDLNENPNVGPDSGVFNSSYFTGFNLNNHLIPHYLLKVWDKYDYFVKTGEYSHSDIPLADTYASNSVFLYKYLVVDEFFMRSMVYYTDLVSLPIYDASDLSYNFFGGSYLHNVDTFINTPNQKVNNVIAVPDIGFVFGTTNFSLVLKSVNTYFEVVQGYPRNHYTHKMERFSKSQHPLFQTLYTNTIYVKGKQTIDTTIDTTGVSDGTYPVASNNVSNMNVKNAGNVIQTISSNAGTVIPGGSSNTTNASNTSAITTTTLTPATAPSPQLVTISNSFFSGITGIFKVSVVDNKGHNIGSSFIKLTPQQIKDLKTGKTLTMNGINYKLYGPTPWFF